MGKTSLFAALAVAALFAPAAAETITFPGTAIVIDVPDGRYFVDSTHANPVMATLDQRSLFGGVPGPGSCADFFARANGVGGWSVEAAVGVPAGWSTQRAYREGRRALGYCRDLAGGSSLVVSVFTKAPTDDGVMEDIGPVLRAIDVALATQAAPPPPPAPTTVTLRLESVGTLTLPARYVQDGAAISTSDGATMIGAPLVHDGSCDEWFTAPEATTKEAAVGAPGDWYSQRVTMSGGTYFYCRDQGNGTHLREMVISRAADQAADIGPVLQAISAAFTPAASSYTPSTYTPSTYTPTPADDSSYVPPPSAPSGEATTSSDYHYRAPASFATPRWGLAGGQSTLDVGGATHTYAVARVSIAPRYIEDYDDNGMIFDASASAGANGDAFVGDAYSAAGYGVSGSGLAIGGLVVVGADRVGGGFEPNTGAYLGLEGYLRVGFGGSLAFEGDGMITTSTGVDETRAQVSAITHVGDRLLAIGGFYQQWNELGEIYGVAVGLTR